MLKEKIEQALNQQVVYEADSSNLYLAMASWAENEGFDGTSKFLYMHSDEERMHMLKLVQYINERNGKAVIPGLKAPKSDFKSLNELFKLLFEHEVFVSQKINELVELSLSEKDYSTHNFLQWYVSEQIEEERLARLVLDKLELIGNDKGGLYLFDRDIATLHNNNGA